MHRKLIIVGLLFLINGCATTENATTRTSSEQSFKESWQNSHKKEVVNKFGAPIDIRKDTLGNETFMYQKRGPMDSMRLVFTFDSLGKVIFLKLDRFIEDPGQLQQQQIQAQKESEFMQQQSINMQRMNDGFRRMSLGVTPYRGF